MPFSVRGKGNEYEIYNTDTGEVVGTSDSEGDAKVAARIRTEASKRKGEKLRECKPILNMSNFVNDIASKVLAEEEKEVKVKTINEREYRSVPKEMENNITGAMVSAFGIVNTGTDDKKELWVPIENFKALEAMNVQILKNVQTRGSRLQINLGEGPGGIKEFDGTKYYRLPENSGLSGSMGAMFEIIKREGRLWVPFNRFEAFKKTMDKMKKDLGKGKTLAEDGREPKFSPKEFRKMIEFGLLDQAVEAEVAEDREKEESQDDKDKGKEKSQELADVVSRAMAKVDTEETVYAVELARKAGTPGKDSEGNDGVWVQINSGPLFIRKGENAKSAFERKEKNIERGGFLGPGHKETRRSYKRVWRQAQGDPIMRDIAKTAGISDNLRTAIAAIQVAKTAKDAIYQEILSKRKISATGAKIRNLNERLKGAVKKSPVFDKIVKTRDVYRRLAVRYSKVRKPAKRVVGLIKAVKKKDTVSTPTIKDFDLT